MNDKLKLRIKQFNEIIIAKLKPQGTVTTAPK